jgi:hypothetical protein
VRAITGATPFHHTSVKVLRQIFGKETTGGSQVLAEVGSIQRPALSAGQRTVTFVMSICVKESFST